MFSIHGFDDFCLWMYVLIDDWYQIQSALPKRPGPAPQTCSDSELLTMLLVGECRGWGQESELLSSWRQRPDLFPRLPSLSRLNRRRRQLANVLPQLHQFMLRQMAWSQDPVLILDSVPLAVVSRAHAAHANRDWRIHQAGYGYAYTKRLPFFGYYLHVLMTYGGVILDWMLTSTATADVAAALDLLHHTPTPLAQRVLLADKGYTSAALRAVVQQTRALRLLVLPKRDMRAAKTLPVWVRRSFCRLRQRIETLNSQLVQQFDVEHTTAHSFAGMVARLQAKLTAHVCCVYCRWCCGAALDQALRIKAFVFSA